jgi:MoaA/NifB/PqqE/SkfB family radical SAM enzyme
MQKGAEISFDKLEKIFKEMDAEGVKTIQVSGGGEPLFHKEIRKILENLKNYPFQIGTITTNGILMSRDISRKLLSVVRNQITISLNFHKPEVYKEFMKTPEKNFYLVLKNIECLIEEKKLSNKENPLIILQFLINGENWKDMPEMLDLGKKLKADGVAFNPLCHWNERRDLFLEKKEEFLKVVKKVYGMDEDGIIWNLHTLIPEINLQIQDLREKYFKGKYPRVSKMEINYNNLLTFCIFPWFAMHLKADGNVYPCCVLLIPSFKPFGNVYKNSLKEIWEGKRFKNFRKKMSSFIKINKKANKYSNKISPKFFSFYYKYLLKLPTFCTQPNSCFLKALPYLEDSSFCISVDSLGRCKNKINVVFPEILKDNNFALIKGRLGKEKKIEIKVNKFHTGYALIKGKNFEFGFLPNPLQKGFHLIEIYDQNGNILASKVVEKI